MVVLLIMNRVKKENEKKENASRFYVNPKQHFKITEVIYENLSTSLGF